MKIILDDTKSKAGLYPFTATRHVADIRIGILTIREKWQRFSVFEIDTNAAVSGRDIPGKQLTLDANIIPAEEWLDKIKDEGTLDGTLFTGTTKTLAHPWQIFEYNDQAIREDFKIITKERISQPVSATNKVIGKEGIFLEQGAIVEHSILNASAGPVYIGQNALVMEGCMIRGPFALCEGAILKMGSKVYGATTIGPYCTVAGEIKNAVLFGFSNKAHDGYLGDSVIGEWCNLGAGTTNSNVKNTAGEVKIWSKQANDFVPVGLKCGLLMGDYSRAAINTSFNTGTIAGVCCNIFGNSFPPKFIDDFTWGKERYIFEKALQDIDNWKQLKGKRITENEITMLKHLYTKL